MPASQEQVRVSHLQSADVSGGSVLEWFEELFDSQVHTSFVEKEGHNLRVVLVAPSIEQA